jgi:serine/threonine protein kinase
LDKEHLLSSGMVEQVRREIAILKRVRHPHIANLIEVMSSKDKIFMVMELITGGELFDKVATEGPLREPPARVAFAQLLSAVAHCHARGIYHRDLKPENVLLASDGSVKLSDFGLGAVTEAAETGPAAMLTTTCGTPNYIAPEVLAKRGYDGAKADVWSLGERLFLSSP